MKVKYYFFILLCFSSCADYKLHVTKENKNWEEGQLPKNDLEHRMYLIGDAGNAPLDGTTNVLKYLKKKIATETINSSVVFLGDNIYPVGMPPKEGNQKDRQLAEHRLQSQMDALSQFKGRSFFIPGNHDWQKWGLKGLRREEQFIENYMNQGIDKEEDWENYFLPDNGCAGPEVIDLSPNLVLIVIDSQWWLADWDREPTINSDCAVKNRGMLTFMVENALRKNRKKNVVIAMHHPMYSNGPHGGNLPIKDHIFPLTQLKDNLYLPLPVIGSVAAFMRGTIGTKQDVANRNFQSLKNALLTSAVKNGSFIFVSGHEHNLQYLENREQTFIVSGAGSKKSPSKIGKGAGFAFGTKGFTTIDFYKDGQSWVQFWQPNEMGTTAKVVFRKKLKEKLVPNEANMPTSFPIYEKRLDSIEMTVTQTKAGDIGFVHKAILGSHHRKLYQQTYKFPVLDLTRFKEGVKPVKRGGGGQTNSLRLETPGGKQYVMRAMTKDVSRTLPFPFNKMSAARFIAEDNFFATHPFAPTAIPTLADAALIYHTNPKLYFIPKQPALGIYNDDYGGDVYLVEERPSGNWENTNVFGNAKKIISTPKVSEKVLKNHKHDIDQEWALRSRLFDVLIGDWDRHDDQWRWARFEEGEGHHVYRPIPRDRDQAFSNYDGFAIKFARLFMPFLRQLRVYGPTIKNMKWISWSSRYFDHSFINELDWNDWENQVQFLQDSLSDEIIEAAFKNWTSSVQDLTADHIIKTIKARRDNLPVLAKKYYDRLAKKVDVYGTDQKELFDIERRNDGTVKVSIWELDETNKQKHHFYDRVFDSKTTKEIHVYGVGDNDQFKVTGEANKSLLIRLIGGQGEDVFIDESSVKRGGKKTFVYDDLTPNSLQSGEETKDKRSHHRALNIYDRKTRHYEHNFFYALPILGANPDDGFLIGANAVWTTYAFKKTPYAALHHLKSTYAFSTKAWSLDYEGDFLNAFDHSDFHLAFKINSPSFSTNFFGLGNETLINNSIDYYRTRQSQIHVFPAIKQRFANEAGNIKIGPLFELRNLEATPGRFLIAEFQEDASDDLYASKTFLGAKLDFEYMNLDNYVIPRKGIHFTTTIDYLNGLNNDRSKFGRLRSTFSFYQSLDAKENLVLASRLGVGTNIGNNFEFYHAPNLGGRQSLRGYRAERFYGKTVFWQNIDLRARLLSSYNQTLPFTFGVYAGFDYGRIWQPNEISKQWHHNYGGGFWIAPVDVLTFTFGAFQPRETQEGSARFIFQLGLGF